MIMNNTVGLNHQRHLWNWQAADFSSHAENAAWLADDSCTRQPYPPDCLDSPNAIIVREEGQNFRLAIMVFWYSGHQGWWSWFFPNKLHNQIALLQPALLEIEKECKRPEEAVVSFDDLGSCVMRKFTERQLFLRAALMVPRFVLKVAAPQGFIYKSVQAPTASGFERSSAFLLLPDIPQ